VGCFTTVSPPVTPFLTVLNGKILHLVDPGLGPAGVKPKCNDRYTCTEVISHMCCHSCTQPY